MQSAGLSTLESFPYVTPWPCRCSHDAAREFDGYHHPLGRIGKAITHAGYIEPARRRCFMFGTDTQLTTTAPASHTRCGISTFSCWLHAQV